MDFRLPLLVFTGVAAFAITAIIVLLTIGTINNANVFGGAPYVIHTVTNESDNTGAIVMVNTTGYTLSGYNSSWNTISSVALWVNITDSVPYLVPTTNYSISSVGVLTNITINPNQTQYNNASISYTYRIVGEAPLGQLTTGNLTGNVSAGVNTVSAKLPTVFLVVAIILVLSAIAILVETWRRFSSGGGTFG